MLIQPVPVVKCPGCRACYWLADAQHVGELSLHVAIGADSLRVRTASWLKRLGLPRRWQRRICEIDPDWVTAGRVLEPEEEDYYSAIAAGLADDLKEEQYLRVLGWWRANDADRHAGGSDGHLPAERDDAFRENLIALFGILDDGTESSLVMRAEIQRELGNFDAAIRILDRIDSDEYLALVIQLKDLCDAKDASVRPLILD